MKRITLLFLLSFFAFRQLDAQCVVDISPGLSENLHGVHFFNANVGMAVGDAGTIVITNDGGASWNITADAHTGQNLNSVFMVSASEAWAVGEGGVIRHTTDGGLTWHQQYSPTTCNLTDVQFKGGNGIIVGECSIILIYDSANGTWNSRRASPIKNLFAVRFIDDDMAIASGEDGFLFKTVNAGATWNVVPSPTTINILGFELNANSGYLSNANGDIFLSDDAGATWTTQTSTGNTATAFAAFNSAKAISVGQNAFVSKTNNAGTIWEDLTNPSITGDLASATFPDSTVAYAVGEMGLVVKIHFLEIISSGDTLVCDGSAVSLSTEGPGIPVGYQWTGPNYSSVLQNPTFNAAPNNSGQFVITASLNGCATTDTLELIVADLPDASAVGFDITCDPNAPNSLQGFSNTPNVIYQWVGPSPSNTSYSGQTVAVSQVGEYTLTVSDENGCSSTATALVTTSAEIPAIGIVPAMSITQLDCNNTAIDLESVFSIQNYELTWTLPDNSTLSTNSITASSPGDYQLNILNTTNGCENDASIELTANFATPTAEVVSVGIIGCANNTADLTADSDIGTTFVWVGPPPSTTIYSGQTVTVPQGGEYTLTVTADNGCDSTTTAMVATDYNSPPLSISPNQNQEGCLGDTLSISATTNAPILEWSTGSTDAVLEIPLDMMGAETYTITATGNNGCDSTLSITIATNPTPGALASATDIDCSGEGQLIGNSQSGSQISYEWQFMGSFYADEQNTAVTQPGTYTLIVTDTQTGCQSENMVDVGFEQGIPDATIEPPAETTINCLVDEIILTGSSTTPGATIEWFDENNASLGSNNSVTIVAGGTYTLQVTNPALPNCPVTETITISQDTDVETFTIEGAPIPCQGQSTTLSAIPNSPGANITYEWTGPITGSGSSLSVDAPGNYQLIGTNPANGCTHSESYTVTMDSPPTVSLGNNLNICDLANNPYTIAPNPPTWANYKWSNNATTPSISVNMEGNYAVTVTDQNGCTAVNEVSISNSDNFLTNQTANLCPGSIIEVGGTVITEGGIYQITLPGNAPECDTILTLNVDEIPLNTSDESAHFCQGGSVTLHGIIFTTATDTTITLEGNGNECDTIVNLKVSQIETFDTPVLVGEEMPCAGSTEIFTIQNYVDTLDYNWPIYPLGTTILDNGATVAITFGNSSGPLQIEAKDVHGCFTKNSELSIEIVDIPKKPLPTDVPFPCTMQPTTLSVQVDATVTSYNWTLPDGSMQTTDSPTSPSFSVDTEGPFTVSVVAVNKCGESPQLIIPSSALPRPAAVLSGDTILCPGESAQLAVNLTGNNPWTVVYNDGSGNDFTFSTSLPSYVLNVSPDETTTYTLTSVQSGGCEGSVSGISAVTVIQDTATATIYAQICTGDMYDFYGKTFEKTGVHSVPIFYTPSCSTEHVLDLLVVDPDSLIVMDTTIYKDAGEGSYQLPDIEILYPDPDANFVGYFVSTNEENIDIQNNSFRYSGKDSLTFDYIVNLEACPDVTDTAHIKMYFRSHCFSAKNDYMPKAFITEGSSSVAGGINERFDPCEAVAYCIDPTSDCSDLFLNKELVIYNGWGEVVFKSKNEEDTVWEKDKANNFPEATYYYSFKFTYLGKTEIIKGPISIVKKKND